MTKFIHMFTSKQSIDMDPLGIYYHCVTTIDGWFNHQTDQVHLIESVVLQPFVEGQACPVSGLDKGGTASCGTVLYDLFLSFSRGLRTRLTHLNVL